MPTHVQKMEIWILGDCLKKDIVIERWLVICRKSLCGMKYQIEHATIQKLLAHQQVYWSKVQYKSCQ